MIPCADCGKPCAVLVTVTRRNGTRQIGPCCWREADETRATTGRTWPTETKARTTKAAPQQQQQQRSLGFAGDEP